MATKLYCLCRRPYEPSEFMIECEICKDWFHGRCVGVQEHQASDIETYHCPSCQATHGPLVLKKRRVIQRPNYSEADDNYSRIVKTGTVTFMRELKQRTFPSGDEIPILRMSGFDLTKSFLEQRGFEVPILVDKKDGLDMKVPPTNFTVQDVESCVGSMREIDVIDVARQEDCKMLMRDWTEYYNSPDRRKIYNVISLEFTNTPLAELVEPPRIVRDMSWVSNYWPKDSQPSDETSSLAGIKPEIQRYCLMGVKDSFTDFHIDFGGTSVWYHVLRGEKVFYFVRPTASNLSLYEHWLSSSNQSETFFGDQADVCYRCIIKQGQTVFIPTGWIHAVLTPIDTLVFGGNFLHSLSVDLQIRVYEIEKRVKTPDKYLFPYYETLHWYTANNVLNYLRGCSVSGRRPIQYMVDSGKALCTALKSWMHKKDTSHQPLIPASIQPNVLIKDLQKELKKFLNPRDHASLRDSPIDNSDDVGKRVRRKRSYTTMSPKKSPGESLLQTPTLAVQSPLRMAAKGDFQGKSPDACTDGITAENRLLNTKVRDIAAGKTDSKTEKRKVRKSKKACETAVSSGTKLNLKISVDQNVGHLLPNDWSAAGEDPGQIFEDDANVSMLTYRQDTKDDMMDRSPTHSMLTSYAAPFTDGFDPFQTQSVHKHAIDDFELQSPLQTVANKPTIQTSSVYDFVVDDGGHEMSIGAPIKISSPRSGVRWVDGLSTDKADLNQSLLAGGSGLKLKVTGGKIVGSNMDQMKPGKFVQLAGTTPIMSPPVKVNDSDSDSEQHLIVDESKLLAAGLKSGSQTKSGLLKLKLSVNKQQSSVGSQQLVPGSSTTTTVVSDQRQASGDQPALNANNKKTSSDGADFSQRLSIPVIRGGINSNISDILEASGYGTETDIRIDEEYRSVAAVCASPKMRDAIQGMLSMSCGSRLLNSSALLRSSSSASPASASAHFVHKRSSLATSDDIDAKLMSCYRDSEFVYPGLDISDSEDNPRSKNGTKQDEAWNPKAKLVPSCPKPERQPRQGVRRESVESTLAATAAKLSALSPRKRLYVKRKPKPPKKTCLGTELSPPSTSAGPLLSSSAPASFMSAAIEACKQPVQNLPKAKKLKKGMATAKQRLGKKLKIHKMLF